LQGSKSVDFYHAQAAAAERRQMRMVAQRWDLDSCLARGVQDGGAFFYLN